MSGSTVDDRFYQAAEAQSVGERVLIAARDRIYADFLRVAAPRPDETILDVGVSDVINDGANMLERLYPHPARITAAGLGEGSDFRAAFPEAGYVRLAAGDRLPFADGQFDIAVSNAVIEHVGGPAQQRFFVAELARVSRRVFLTAPNAMFPVEHHTAIPFAHWWRPSFVVACKTLGKQEWLEPANLVLIRRRDLEAAVPSGRRARTGYTGLPLGRFSSNLYLAIEPAE